MPSRLNKKKGKAPAGTKGNSRTTLAIPAIGTGGTSSHSAANPVPPAKPAATALPAADTTLITNLRHGVRSFLSSLHANSSNTSVQWRLQRSLEAHLRNHYTSIQSDATWQHILGWPPWHSAASARESLHPGRAELESPYNLPPATDFETPQLAAAVHTPPPATANTYRDADGFVQVVGRRRGIFFPDVDAWDQVPSVSSQAPPARCWGVLFPDVEPWDQVTSQASPGSGSEARRTSYSSVAALELAPAYRPPDHVSVPTSRAPTSPLMSRVQMNSSRDLPDTTPQIPARPSPHRQDEFCTGSGGASLGVKDFQPSFSHYPAVDLDDVYEFPALPAAATRQLTRQPVWGTPRDPAQLGRNSSLRQQLVAECMTPPVPRSAAVPHSQPEPMRAPSTTPPPQSSPVDAGGDLTRKLAEEASILLELYSQSTCGDLESDLQHRETIKSVLDNVTKIWDRLSQADKGKQTGVVNGWEAVAKPESDPALSPYSGCIICYSVVADALLMPCRHLVLCLVSGDHQFSGVVCDIDVVKGLRSRVLIGHDCGQGCCDTMRIQESTAWGAPQAAEGVKCPLCRVEVTHRVCVNYEERSAPN